jgi:L-methionine (R)-S-oxide reductase
MVLGQKTGASAVKMITKEEKERLYKKAIDEINDRLKNLESGIIVPRMATVCSVLKYTMPHFFWCGFYFAEEGELVIGPYQGTAACANIEYAGVCGTSARKKESIIVPDVEKFPGHIQCDPESKSEIVIPLIDKGSRVIAILDIDASEYDAFDETDEKYLKSLVPIILEE